MTASHRITTPDGVIEIGEDAVEALVRRAAESVDGVRLHGRRRGLDVAVDDGRARVSLELTLRYGTVVGEVARAVQEQVADALADMCGLVVDAVDVAVEELGD